MAKKPDAGRILEEWTERDLTAEARAGELPRAYDVEETLERVVDLLASGKLPILTGESGVGKSAVVFELVRRTVAGGGPPVLSGKRVLQLSFRHRAAGLKEASALRPEMQKLVEALHEKRSDVFPFFRDIHLAEAFGVEPQLQALGYRLPGGVLAEGDRLGVAELLESAQQLDEAWVALPLEEPGLDRMAGLLSAWAADAARRSGKSVAEEALEEALHLAHRFLPRSRFPRKALDLLGAVVSLAPAGSTVLRADVVDRFARAHRVPRLLLDPAVPVDLGEVRRRFSREVLGQAEAVEAVVRMIGLIKSGLSDMRRPFGVFLFVGPTGVGKTHVAQLLAEFLFGARDRLIRLNMADYQSKGSADVLFGDVYDTRLSHRRGVLTQRVAGQPFGVLLLDEFEKATEEVHDRFLQLFDEGAFLNGASETVSCRSMILIATSNAGADVYQGRPLGFFRGADLAALSRELLRKVTQRFRPEFLNRFDQVVQFRPLTREEVRAIAQRELSALKERPGLARRQLALEVDESVVDWLAVHGYDPHFGARFLRRTLERHVTSAIAEAMVGGPLPPGAHLHLTTRGGRVEARVVRKAASAARPITSSAGRASRSDLETLRERARAVRRAVEPRLGALGEKREAARALLCEMNEPGFWERGPESRERLLRYRELDVDVQIETRLAAAIEPLERTLAEPEQTVDRRRLALELEGAERARREWDARLAEAGPRAVWLLLERADPLQPASPWIAELVAMELAWCERLDLSARVVACEIADEELARAVIEVDGPGAGTALAMEEGLHRLHRKQGPDLKARIESVGRGAGSDRAGAAVEPLRPRNGPLGPLAWKGRLEVPGVGLAVDLQGPEAEPLAELIPDLAAARERSPGTLPATARVYGQGGVGARDPRTGAIVVRFRDALKGELDPLLAAWRERDLSPPAAG